MKLSTLSILLLVCACFTLQSCTSLISAARDEPIATDPTNRTIGTRIDDERLEVIAKVNIKKALPELKGARIEVDSFNSVILLTGQVATQDLRQQAAQIVKRIDKVRQVHNELQVKSNIAFTKRTKDAWLVTKIKSKLLANKNIVGSKIKVVAEDRTIFLMGLVNQVDAQKITDITSNTSGVRSVVRVFEYVDGTPSNLGANNNSTDGQDNNTSTGVDIESGLQIIE